MPKPKALSNFLKVPNPGMRKFVQQQAERYGFERKILEDGQPMLTKKPKQPTIPIDMSRIRRAKVVGPATGRAKVGAVRG